MELLKKKDFGFREISLCCFFTMNCFLAVMGRTLKDFPEECFTANEIDDDTRAFENHNVPTSKADDLALKKGWYRIMGKSANSLKQGFDRVAGNTDNAPNFCGTVYAGTLMGEHPTVEEGMIEMTVCFRERFCFFKDIGGCECKSKKSVYVRNCQNHFIYWLSPTNRQERYCTGRTSLTGVTVKEGFTSDAVECRQYREFDTETRVWDKRSDVQCDNDNEGWYRYLDASGGEMASECRVNRESISRLSQPCGAAFRGWMIDRHPTLAEGRRNSRVCFSYPDSCSCEFFSNVAVRNCGTYFVYRVNKPPVCNSRYCGAPVGSKQASNDKIKPSLMKKKNICEMYNVLHDPSRLWSYTSPMETNCDARLYGYYRFGSKYTPWSVKEGCNKNDMNTVTHRCGSAYQGFLEDRHPTVSEGYVERVICYQDATVPCECQFSSVIGVQNCSGFYVYEMRGVPRCSSRICMVANGTDLITVDVDQPPLYDIPAPGYKIVVTQESSVPKEDNEAVITTTILCIVILIILILIVIIVLIALYLARPILKRKDKKDPPKELEENHVEERQELLVESCLSHENETDDDLEDPIDHQYSSVPESPAEKQEDEIVKRSDLVPETPPEERRNGNVLIDMSDEQEPDIQKAPDSEEETETNPVSINPGEKEEENEVDTAAQELDRVQDDLDEMMNDLDNTRSDIVNLLAGDTPV